MSARPPVAITGLGAVCSVGATVAELRSALASARPGLRTLSRFDPGDLPRRPVGEVPCLPGDPSEGTPTHRLAVAAAREAVADADLTVAPERLAVVVGTTTGGIGESEGWYLARSSPERLPYHPASTVTHAVARAIGALGPRLTLATACTSGANAISLAADLLLAGEADAVVAGGANALCRLTWAGFSSLRLMSDVPCRPFDAGRDGLNLGEAGAFVVLQRRASRPHAWLTGAAVTCDAHHMTAPAPGGAQVQRAIHQALAAAGLRPQDLAYVNAHATATPANDRAEAAALRAALGSLPPVSATKSVTGHTLGAAGALEAVITTLAVRDGLLPATLGTTEPEPGAPDDLVLGAARSADVPHALSTSFAFGGNNAALVISR